MHIRLLALTRSCALSLALVACGSNGGNDKQDDMPTGSGGNGLAGSPAPVNNAPAGSGGNTASKPATGSGGSSASNGSGGTPAVAGSGGAASTGTGGSMAPPDKTAMPYPDPRGKCGLDTGFPDDNACLLAPGLTEGMQIHIGPTDYKNMDQINAYVMHQGDESSECVSFHTPNSEDIYYQSYVLSGRAGTHHIINTIYKEQVDDSVGFTVCMNEFSTDPEVVVDTLPGASRAYHERGIVAPENEHIGRKVPAKSSSQADMHYFNYTEGDILREFWMNIYFVPKEKIQEEAKQIRGMGGTGWTFNPIAPGTDMVYKYSCPIDSDGRIIQLLGHYHAHGKRFTAYLNRAGGAREKVFEMYDYKDPRTFQYDSVTTNPMFSDVAPGAFTGQLMVKSGDTLDWECHIINDSNVDLTYTNMVNTGEMCNLWGASLGPKIACNRQ